MESFKKLKLTCCERSAWLNTTWGLKNKQEKRADMIIRIFTVPNCTGRYR